MAYISKQEEMAPARKALWLEKRLEAMERQLEAQASAERLKKFARDARRLDRAQKAAELIGEEAGPMRVRLHPDDLELLSDAPIDTPLLADNSLPRGTIRLETDEGWIEDGPEARLERLRAALDQMGLEARQEDAA